MKFRSLLNLAGGIDSGPQTLGGRFLVSGRAIDLPGQEQTRHPFGFKRRLQLHRVHIIVLDGIGGAHDLG